MGELKLRPYANMSNNQLFRVADWLHTTVSIEGGAQDLIARNLHGVAERHSQSTGASFRSLKGVREDMERGLLSAFVIDNTYGMPIGQATIIPGVELRRQRTSFPPVFDRLLSLISGRTVDTSNLGANTSAWLHTSDLAADRRGLTEVYGALRRKTDGPLWTIEPVSAAHDVLHPSSLRAIEDAGFKKLGGDPAYYDAQESPFHGVSKSYLLVAPPIEQ